MGPESSDGTGGFPDPREPHFEAIFNDPHVFMALLDPDGTITDVNRAAVELVRPDRAEIVGTPFWEGPWWAHSAQVQTNLRWRVERAADGDYLEFETEYLTGEDEQRLTAGFLRPVLDDEGAVVSIVASGIDTTEFVHQQQQLEVLQRILRHNFRNGLTVIRGYAEELVADLSPSTDEASRDELREMAQLIATEADALEASVSKIQRLERPDDERLERITVDSLFDRVEERIEDGHPNCELAKTVADPEIEVPIGVTTAVAEAVTNAIAHHPRSDPTIELTATVSDDSDVSRVHLGIADDGAGIPACEAEPVLNGEETALTHASGVGLWLIKWAVERYGGEISIQADESRGSRITLIYPVSPPSR